MRRLRNICLSNNRLQEVNYKAFLKEIGAIEIHGYEDYYLYLIDNNIKVTNSCNSIVAYLCNITDEKPIKTMEYIPGSLPDIDIDVSGEKRDEVIKYLVGKYGSSKTAHVGAYNFFYGKSAIRAVGKALGYEQEFLSKIAKMFPDPVQGVQVPMEESINTEPAIQHLMEVDERAKNLIKWALKMQGVINSKQIHAAGILIADTDINKEIPLSQKDDVAVSEFDKDEIESIGFVKYDLLGLKTLDIIDHALKIIKQRRGIELTFDEIPIDDKSIYKLLPTGNLLGVFQLEGDGISGCCTRVKPDKFDDIVLIAAGWRPGPMKFMNSITAVKNGGEVEMEPHAKRFPILEPILKETYG